MYSGSGVAVAAPNEKLCPRTLILYRFLLGLYEAAVAYPQKPGAPANF